MSHNYPLIKTDYRSFYRLQNEVRNMKLKMHITVKVKDELLRAVDWFMYLPEQKQVRYLSEQFLGERRIYDINPEDIEISDYFIHNFK